MGTIQDTSSLFVIPNMVQEIWWLDGDNTRKCMAKLTYMHYDRIFVRGCPLFKFYAIIKRVKVGH